MESALALRRRVGGNPAEEVQMEGKVPVGHLLVQQEQEALALRLEHRANHPVYDGGKSAAVPHSFTPMR